MSRSYKRPWVNDRNPWAKRQANKMVRRAKVISIGKWYKKLYCSYNICDYKWFAPELKKAYRK